MRPKGSWKIVALKTHFTLDPQILGSRGGTAKHSALSTHGVLSDTSI